MSRSHRHAVTYRLHVANYTAKDITVLEGLEPVRKRPGIHRWRRHRRPAPSRLGNPRQRRRRGDERLRLEHPGRAAQGRQLDHRHRRWSRNSRRQTSDDEEERDRSHLHDASCRRKVRARELQDRRRFARCRRERRQRPLERAARDGEARRNELGDGVQARQADRSVEEDRSCARDGHDGLFHPDSTIFPRWNSTPRSSASGSR